MIITRYRKITLFILLGATIIIFLGIYSYFFSWKTKEETDNGKDKILLIGLDGLTWDVMYPLVIQNKLPNIKRLMDNGCWGDLKSLYPLISEVIWTTIATGKRPKQHGITDSLIKNPDTGELTPVTSNLRQSKALWDILSEQGKSVGLAGYRVTWPPEKVNGVIISDRAYDAEYSSQGYTYPSFRQLCSQSEFEVFKNNDKTVSLRARRDMLYQILWEVREKDDFLYQITQDIKRKDSFMADFAIHLRAKRDFDFFTIYLDGADRLSHLFYKYIEPQGFDVPEDEIKRYGNIIKDYYVYYDQIIGDLLNKIDKDTTVIIVSDHGFKARDTKKFNYLFSGLDYLLEIDGLSNIHRGSKTIVIRETPENIFNKKNNIEMDKNLSSKELKALERKIKKSFENIFNGKKNIRIEGDLSEEEFNSIREKIRGTLRQIIIEENRQSLFNSIQDSKKGLIVELDMAYINLHPECHLIVNNKRYKMLDFLVECPLSGEHAPAGIIIVSGKNIRHKKIGIASVYDIVPTILYLLRLPVAEDMDGIVLKEIIDTGFLKNHPVKYVKSYETGVKKESGKPISSPLDEILKQRMRNLGYIN